MEKRQYYIDWIRVLAFGLLIFYHTGMFFVSWGWHVKNNVIVQGHEFWMEIMNPWRLPLLFFISGVGVSFALKSRSAGHFIGERAKRLLIPLAFGMFVIVTPQIYFERLQNNQFSGSYFEFFPLVFNFVPYPKGNFSWHHLWFVAYLFVFSVLATPFFLWIKNKSFFNFENSFTNYLKVVACFLPLSICYFLLRNDWPTTHNLVADWYNFSISFLFFILGYVIGGQPINWNIFEKYRKINLSIALGWILFSMSFDAIFGSLSDDTFWVQILNSVMKMLVIWCMIMAICGFAKHHLNFSNSFVKYANRAVYPFYILHQTIIIIIGFYIADYQVHHLIKFFFIVISTFGVCGLIYNFWIRPFAVMRLFFGVK